MKAEIETAVNYLADQLCSSEYDLSLYQLGTFYYVLDYLLTVRYQFEGAISHAISPAFDETLQIAAFGAGIPQEVLQNSIPEFMQIFINPGVVSVQTEPREPLSILYNEKCENVMGISLEYYSQPYDPIAFIKAYSERMKLKKKY
jgi:hypothetical protein